MKINVLITSSGGTLSPKVIEFLKNSKKFDIKIIAVDCNKKAISKYFADEFLSCYTNILILRVPILYGPTHKKQLISRLLLKIMKNHKIYASSDVYSTPLYIPELAKIIVGMINSIHLARWIKHLHKFKKIEVYIFPVFPENSHPILRNISSINFCFISTSMKVFKH